MRWAIERVFGWDEARQHASFAEWFKPEEVSVITADGLDVGWIQQRLDDNGILLGSIYVAPAMQRKGIGSGVIQPLLQLGRQKSKPVTLAVMKINPALALYERLGFRITHEDEYKVYNAGRPSRRLRYLLCSRKLRCEDCFDSFMRLGAGGRISPE